MATALSTYRSCHTLSAERAQAGAANFCGPQVRGFLETEGLTAWYKSGNSEFAKRV